MSANIAPFVSILCSIGMLVGISVGGYFSFRKHVETKSLACSPVNDSLRFVYQALNNRTDIYYSRLILPEPLSNGNVVDVLLTKLLTYVDISVVVPTVDFQYLVSFSILEINVFKRD